MIGKDICISKILPGAILNKTVVNHGVARAKTQGTDPVADTHGANRAEAMQ